ncbi:CoA-acylating methylmalonate-semialdehyde dehydrogenase|uniref:Malonate-semialdehyde dehydrogenase (Acetylating) / methylmalonate-semialdehyde dehydrogenase n=1 Tax=Dendrosporobacter quercicolus TaxID=146817 RepID=A0A1G9MY23_9FIRM|nr:CoA-acylating methylmalonate-semialdehyde dehydrogenase [Dendrosporobacter quercicolus]NSL47170.1 CoA-acylating methylmalonate-semialdehyde dehydrogenase [Dendrosporobacter quercicolus DSM 1736]SDL79024.1 malonate-semialdehyde dehydrogenase (acetylating) / methylmalonate-semialdehyde dehydrogenase [Dendrosporobacter quercicolus]
MSEIIKLKYFCNGQFVESKTEHYDKIYDPSTGAVIAHSPRCTKAEVLAAIEAAKTAYPAWSNTPPMKRAQILYRIRELIMQNLDELTLSVATENGKAWLEAQGDVLKAKEGTELACGIPSLLMGESLMDTANGVDTTLYRESVGVFAGLVPFNFPAMIPFGWMAPLCIAAGNTIVLKASSMTPMTAYKMAQIYKEAGVPDGVVNVVTCSRVEAELFLTHEDVRGITFVGSTSVGKHIYSVAAAHGKRVQALCEAKNHALVLEDAPLERTAAGIINAAFGCAGERCMALPVVVVQESIADKLVELLVQFCKEAKVGPAYDKATNLGPVVTEDHKKSIVNWIETGIKEGAKLVLDGRDIKVSGYEKGAYIGHTIFDHVTSEMTVGQKEIFGPVLCIKRVKNFEEGITAMNANPYANGSVIFTQNGYYAREFTKRTHGGMVGVNVGIPVPVGVFPFSGHKNSFFGDLHCLGKDGVRFYTQTKNVTTKWFNEEERKQKTVSTWDGTI